MIWLWDCGTENTKFKYKTESANTERLMSNTEILNIYYSALQHSVTSYSAASACLLVRDLDGDALELLHVGLQQPQEMKDR